MTAQLIQPALDEIRAAAGRIAGFAVRTPLLRLNVEDAPAEIYLKPECLQPVGSFKIRPAGNVISNAAPETLAAGVYTASSGNMAQGVAWAARELGVSARVIVTEGQVSANKLEALERLGAGIRAVSAEEFWRVIIDHGHAREPGLFIHPVAHQDVITGNATMGLEIVEDLPDVDTVVVPYGGGGLSCGIASALKAVRPEIRVLACEIEGGEPLAAALAAGRPVDVPQFVSWVSGIAVGPVLEEMWPLASRLIDGTVAPGLNQIAGAVRLLFERNRLIAEGGGAASVAAALAGLAGGGKIVCVISGGNIDAGVLATILRGGAP